MSELHAFTGLFRRFRSFVLRRDVEVTGQCKMCGECCHDILLRHKKRWLKKERHFEELCREEPDHQRFSITGRDEFGHLVFACSLQEKSGLCSCHADRLPLCRNYPPKSLYYQGGWLRPDCGYSFKAVTFRDIFMRRKRMRIPKFADVLQQEQERTEQSRLP
ncbi:YkgJ family cysteine cluster protein [uncultured Pseudodesulfovibrio sp.]|uniref:YkgJ family cysteine cluster protein n=1 Tax=uncultured Pseudodesulfovibrio sp. TaxID=2035858 RepID=UPI0029C993D3|nr:YkgJ family cysteine cluster protein [uncultured Pseudodesulfovibrio sp.]